MPSPLLQIGRYPTYQVFLVAVATDVDGLTVTVRDFDLHTRILNTPAHSPPTVYHSDNSRR